MAKKSSKKDSKDEEKKDLPKRKSLFVEDDGKLIPVNYRPIAEDAKYNPDNFSDAYKGHQDVAASDTRQFYGILFGEGKEDIAQTVDSEKWYAQKGRVLGKSQTGLVGHTVNNAIAVANELDKQTQIAYASRGPFFESADDEAFNEAVEKVRKANSELEQLSTEEGQKKFWDGKMDGHGDYEQETFAWHRGTILREYAQLAEHNIALAVSEYGASEFINTNLQNGRARKQDYEGKAKELADELAKKLEGKTDKEKKAIQGEFEERAKALDKEFKDRKGYEPLAMTLAKLSYEAIQKRKAEEEKKKAEESKDKKG